MLNGLCYVVLFGTLLVAAELPAIFSAVTIDVYTTFTVTALRKQYHFYHSLRLPSATFNYYDVGCCCASNECRDDFETLYLLACRFWST